MTKTRSLFLLLFLLLPRLAFAQTTRATGAAANKSWQSFWVLFRSAVNKKDHAALKRLMSSEADFFSGGGGETRDQWIQIIEKRRAWRDLRKSVALGTVPYNEGQRPGRITKDRTLIFQLIENRWRFVGVMGD